MNRVVHFEIQSTDVDAVQSFYEQLFDWKFQKMGEDYGGYRVITTGPGMEEMAKGVSIKEVGINGGLMKRSGTQAAAGTSPNAFTCIVGVEDVDATVEKAQGLGGEVALPAMDIPMVGRVAYLLDPEKTLFGIITPDMSTMHSETE
jgi:predicted enzyme related to lactoylglutathione lyase